MKMDRMAEADHALVLEWSCMDANSIQLEVALPPRKGATCFRPVGSHIDDAYTEERSDL